MVEMDKGQRDENGSQGILQFIYAHVSVLAFLGNLGNPKLAVLSSGTHKSGLGSLQPTTLTKE